MFRPNDFILTCLVSIFLFISAAPLPLFASENSDLEQIPEAVQKGLSTRETPAPGNLSETLSLEEVYTLWSLRSTEVPVPVSQPDWQNRTSLGIRQEWKSSSTIQFHLSDRLDLLEESDFGFRSGGTLHNDFQEGYGSVELSNGTYLEAGRINMKNGVALGYNPTDFFKSRSAVAQASEDPSTLRDFRMGAMMIHFQKIWDRGALNMSYAPRVASESPITMLATPASFDPLFGQTNGTTRWLFSYSHDLADLNPLALLFIEEGHLRFGLSFSHLFGKSGVGYAEWAGGSQSSLSRRATEFGIETGSLPSSATPVVQGDPGEPFDNDGSVGFSWTGSRKITVNLEYHYHQSGLNRSDLGNWFSLGRTEPGLAGELWFVRLYASDQQEPFMQQELFIRAEWDDALISNLNISGFVVVSPYDGSLFGQLSGSYFLSRNWTFAGYLGAALGSAESEYGSLPESTSTAFRLIRYF